MPSDSDLDIQGVDLGIDSLLGAAGLDAPAAPRVEPFSISSLSFEAELDLSGVDELIALDGGADSLWDVPAPRAAVVQRGPAAQPQASASWSGGADAVPEFDVSLPELDEEAGFADTVAGFARIRSEGGARRREPPAGTQRPVLVRPANQPGGPPATVDDDVAILGRARVATRLVRKDPGARADAAVADPADPSGGAPRTRGPSLGAAALLEWAAKEPEDA